MDRRLLWLGGVFAVTLLVVVALAGTGEPGEHGIQPDSIATGSIGIPTGLMLARSYTQTAQVDVLRWNGTAWQPHIPASAIQPITHGDVVLEPDAVLALYPNSLGTKIALWIKYCNAAPIGETEHCTAFGSVFDVASQSHSLISSDERTSPVGWIDDQQLLAYNIEWEYGFTFATDTNTATELQFPIDIIEYSSGIPALDPSGDRVLVSAADGDGVLTIDTGLTVWFEGGPASHTTSWMSFGPGGDRAAVSRIRAGMANTMGAGQVKVFNTQSGDLLYDVTPEGSMDFSPVWSTSTGDLLFLRQDAASFATAQNPDSLGSFSSVQSYDLATGITTQILPADRSRKGLFVVGSPLVIAYLATLNGRSAAYYVADTNGTEAELSPDGLDHTVVSWSE